MNKKVIIIIVAIIVIVGTIVGIFIIKNNHNSANYIGGVEDVDFSSYDITNITAVETITSGGVYNFSGDYEGTIVVNANNKDVKLIINNANITATDGPAIFVEKADNVYIEVVGTNNINATTTAELSGAIYSKSDLCFIGDGILNITSNYDGIVGKDDVEIDSATYNIKASDRGIVGKDSLYIINGTFDITSSGDGLKTTNEDEKGTLTILNGTFNITSSKDGISSSAILNIEGGTYTITTGNGSTTSYNSSESLKGLKATSDLNITSGTFNINSNDDSIHSNGNIKITGGTYTLSSGDDGIHADGDLTISNGNITINKSYEGIEGFNITIDGGNIKVQASDDGFNAAGGDGSSAGRMGSANYKTNGATSTLTINNGTIYVNASGDGIDSNGDIYITGGTTYVDGPTDNGNGAIDYGDGGNYNFVVTGGTLIAVGSSGMAVSPTSGTTVTSVFVNRTTTLEGTITIGSITYTPTKKYNSILICSNSFVKGNKYELKVNGSTIETISINQTVNTYGSTQVDHGGGDHGGGAAAQQAYREQQGRR